MNPHRARSALFGLVLAAQWAMVSTALSADTVVGGVPLPDGIAIAPASGGSASSGRFLGAWVGAWNDILKHVLIVEAIDAGGTAQIVSAIGDDPAVGVNQGWVRTQGSVSGDTLTVMSSSTATYSLDDRTLTAAFQHGSARSNARLSPVALTELVRPDARIAWTRHTTEFLDTALMEDGRSVRLEVVLFKPDGTGPFPLLVIHHGSTGSGTDARSFRQTRWSFAVADFFTRRGWLVAFPHRRGRGNSDGLYDEGFNPDRSLGYTCEPERSLAGADRALEDVHAAMTALRLWPTVDPRHVMIGGISRGGALSIAYAGQHPDDVLGVVNFVGGWIGTGCPSATDINGTMFRRGGSFPGPTIWLYGRDDVFYSVDHSRSNFDAFERAGGKGEFFEFDVPGTRNGHALNGYPELWARYVEKFMATIRTSGGK